MGIFEFWRLCNYLWLFTHEARCFYCEMMGLMINTNYWRWLLMKTWLLIKQHREFLGLFDWQQTGLFSNYINWWVSLMVSDLDFTIHVWECSQNSQNGDIPWYTHLRQSIKWNWSLPRLFSPDPFQNLSVQDSYKLSLQLPSQSFLMVPMGSYGLFVLGIKPRTLQQITPLATFELCQTCPLDPLEICLLWLLCLFFRGSHLCNLSKSWVLKKTIGMYVVVAVSPS